MGRTSTPHTPIYRPILGHALKTAWNHRELWPLAAIAGLAGTGAVLNDVLSQIQNAGNPAASFAQAFQSITAIQTYAANLVFANAYQVAASSVVLVVFFAALIFAIVACQYTVLRVTHRASANREPISGRELMHDLLHPRFTRVLVVDLLFKLLIVNVMVASSYLISELNVNQVITDAFFGTIFAASAITLALTLNVLCMFTLIYVVRSDMRIAQAIDQALITFKKSPVVALEMSALLFAANFVITAAYVGALLILAVPVITLFGVVFELGSFFLFALLSFATVLFLATFSVAVAGFTTTFTYSAWTELAERLNRRAFLPRARVHAKRLLAHFS